MRQGKNLDIYVSFRNNFHLSVFSFAFVIKFGNYKETLWTPEETVRYLSGVFVFLNCQSKAKNYRPSHDSAFRNVRCVFQRQLLQVEAGNVKSGNRGKNSEDREVDSLVRFHSLTSLLLQAVCLLAGENLWQIVLSVGVVAPGARNITGLAACWKQAWSCGRFCDDTETMSLSLSLSLSLLFHKEIRTTAGTENERRHLRLYWSTYTCYFLSTPNRADYARHGRMVEETRTITKLRAVILFTGW